ncbi:MAG: alpha/beta hydrolase [Chloroflexi bacterium]|nr:alpha/beta hydrolase [Chloroflexota bacterium]
MVEVASPIVDRLDRRKLRFVDVDGIRTRYYEDGAGEPLVLFSGGQFASLYSLDSWSLNLPGLAKHFHVYAVDKLAQGHTGNPKRDADYNFEALVQHSAALLRALGISQAHLAGHSRGGLLVTWLAMEYPALVKKVVIVDSGTLAPESPIFPSPRFYDALPQPKGPASLDTVRIEPDAQAYHKEQVTDDFLNRMLECARLPTFQQAKERMEAVINTVWFPSLNRKRQEALHRIEEGGIPVPTLVIWGLNDRSAPFPLGLHLFEHIAAKTPQAELHVLNGAGHYSFRDQATGFNRAVQSFCLG